MGRGREGVRGAASITCSRSAAEGSRESWPRCYSTLLVAYRIRRPTQGLPGRKTKTKTKNRGATISRLFHPSSSVAPFLRPPCPISNQTRPFLHSRLCPRILRASWKSRTCGGTRGQHAKGPRPIELLYDSPMSPPPPPYVRYFFCFLRQPLNTFERRVCMHAMRIPSKLLHAVNVLVHRKHNARHTTHDRGILTVVVRGNTKGATTSTR